MQKAVTMMMNLSQLMFIFLEGAILTVVLNPNLGGCFVESESTFSPPSHGGARPGLEDKDVTTTGTDITVDSATTLMHHLRTRISEELSPTDKYDLKDTIKEAEHGNGSFSLISNMHEYYQTSPAAETDVKIVATSDRSHLQGHKSKSLETLSSEDRDKVVLLPPVPHLHKLLLPKQGKNRSMSDKANLHSQFPLKNEASLDMKSLESGNADKTNETLNMVVTYSKHRSSTMNAKDSRTTTSDDVLPTETPIASNSSSTLIYEEEESSFQALEKDNTGVNSTTKTGFIKHVTATSKIAAKKKTSDSVDKMLTGGTNTTKPNHSISKTTTNSNLSSSSKGPYKHYSTQVVVLNGHESGSHFRDPQYLKAILDEDWGDAEALFPLHSSASSHSQQVALVVLLGLLALAVTVMVFVAVLWGQSVYGTTPHNLMRLETIPYHQQVM